MMISTPNSKPKHNTMGGSRVSPPIIVEVADDGDDDEVSLLYATPTKQNKGINPKNAISVEDYADGSELQHAIMASFSLPQGSKGMKRRRRQNNNIIDLSLDDDDDVQFLKPSSFKVKTHFKSQSETPSIIEIGESSHSHTKPVISSNDSNSEPPITFLCEICVDEKPYTDWFSIMGCSHSYCSDCMINYVASKIQENITQIRCPVPNCRGLLEPEDCRSILPPEVFDRWGSALCEAVILASEKFYCPYKDCSALLIDDGDGDGDGDGGGNGGQVITASECPNCRRLFCVQCKVPWHSDIWCEEFQKLNKDERGREDLMLMQLAKKKKWMRCPKCNIYVERSEGCAFMKCRCGHCFCYNCGAAMTGGGHMCSKCRH